MAWPPEVASAPASSRLGKFIRVSLAGQGGVGAVWKAWDTDLNRWVALKLLRGAIESDIARFLREAKSSAMLTHPNIVRIYESGRIEETPYIAMEWIPGTTISRLPRDVRRLATCIRDAARALHYAHERGTIHRDVKPDNLMLTESSGSVTRIDHLYVLDFGLARTVDASGLTATGTAIGTPAFMPPEQARGQISLIDRRSDVYSLGATLYAVLTGRPPFDADTVFSLFQRIVSDEASPPGIDPDLDTIILCCLDKEPDNRYQTAEALAADLDRWLAGEAVAARPVSLVYRIGKSLRKRRAVVLIASIALVIAATSAVLLGRSLHRASGGAVQAQDDLLAELRKSSDACLHAALDLRRSASMTLMRQQAAALEAVCRRAFVAMPSNPEPHWRLGRLYRALLRHDDALREQTAALALDPAYASARLERGLLRARAYHSAIFSLRNRWHLQHADDRLHGRMEFDVPDRVGLEDAAAKELRAAALQDLDGSDDPLAAGLAAWLRGDDWQTLLNGAAQTDDSAAIEWLGVVLTEDGRPDDAIAWFTRGIQRDAGYIPFYSRRAGLLGTTDENCRLAESDLTRALELTGDDDRAEFLSRRGSLYLHWSLRVADSGGNGDPLQKNALADYAEAVRLKPRDADARAGLAYAKTLFAIDATLRGHDGLTLIREARAEGEEAVRLEDSFATRFQLALVLRTMAWQLYQRGDDATAIIEEAIRCINEAVRANPASWSSWYGRALACQLSAAMVAASGGDATLLLREALASVDKTLVLKPGACNSHSTRGEILADWADFDAARGHDPEPHIRDSLAAHDAAVAAGPGRFSTIVERGSARARFAAIRMSRGQNVTDLLKGAEQDLSDAIKLGPTYALAWSSRGEARLQRMLIEAVSGRDPSAIAKEAIADLDRALELNPRLDDALRHRSTVRANLAYWTALQGGEFDELFRAADRDIRAAADLRHRDVSFLRHGQMLMTWGVCLRQRAGDPLALYERAAKSFDAALSANPSREETWLSRSELHMNWGAMLAFRRDDPMEHYEQGVKDIGAAIKLNESNDALWLRRGQLRVNIGLWVSSTRNDPTEWYRAAVGDYGEALKRNGRWDETWMSRGYVRALLMVWARHTGGEPEELFADLEADFAAALKLNPKNAETLWRRGYGRYLHGSWSDARTDFEAALKINPQLEGRLRKWIEECKAKE